VTRRAMKARTATSMWHGLCCRMSRMCRKGVIGWPNFSRPGCSSSVAQRLKSWSGWPLVTQRKMRAIHETDHLL
jgi:hypothetical protein